MLAYRRRDPPSTRMQSTSRAPELSATRSRDSCWIIGPAPRSPRGATASAWRAAWSRPRARGLRRARCRPRRGRRGAWCAARSCRSAGGGRARRPRRPRSSASCRRPPPPPAPCGGWSASLRRRSRQVLRASRLLLAVGGPLGAGLRPVLPERGEDPRDVLLHLADARRVVQLPRRLLEAEVEQLPARLGQLVLELARLQPEVLGASHQTCTSAAPWVPGRTTKRAFIGSFWIARSIAARASSWSTPESSNRTRPGRTTATQCSGFPFPEPIRVSAGFWVTGLSGKTRIQIFPPRRTWRVIAIRAASIWRAVSHPGSSAWIPKSPKVTVVPPLAAPVSRPRCCLRCLTLRGMSISVDLPPEVRCFVVLVPAPALHLLVLGELALEVVGLGRRREEVRDRPPGRAVCVRVARFPAIGLRCSRRGRRRNGTVARCSPGTGTRVPVGLADLLAVEEPLLTRELLGGELLGGELGGARSGSAEAGAPAATARGDEAARPALPRGLADGHCGLTGDLLVDRDLVGEDVSLVDPDLHPDASRGGLGLAEPVVDVGPQGVQGHTPLPVRLLPRHLGPAEAPRALDPHALGAGLLDRLHRPLHGPPEGDTPVELVADALCDERGVELGLLDLLDVELDPVVEAGELLELLLQAVGLRAAPADDDPRTCGVDVDAEAVARALDLDPADGGGLELGHEVVPDLPVLDDEVAVVALLEPAGLPVGGHTEPEAVRVDLLAHLLALLALALGETALAPRISVRLSGRIHDSGVRGLRDLQVLLGLRDLPGRCGRVRRGGGLALLDGLCLADLDLGRGLGLELGPGVRGMAPAREASGEVRPPARLGDPALALGTGSLPLGPAAREALVGHPTDDHRDVAAPLADARGTAAGTRPPPLERHALVRVARGDVELLGVLSVVVHGVGDRRREELAHDLRRLTWGVAEDLSRAVGVLAADEVEHRTRLGRRHAAVPEDGPGPGALVRLEARHVSASLRVLGPRGSGTCASARTRRACARPSPRSRTPERGAGRRARRSCAPLCRG